MIGNYMNNSQIVSLRKRGVIKIEPFDAKLLRDAHYPLTPAGFRSLGDLDESGNREYRVAVDFAQKDEYLFKPNEFVLAEVQELVVTEGQIFAEFPQNSTLIAAGFLVTTGKLDSGYGAARGQAQKLVFGVKNLLDNTNLYRPEMGLAWMAFVDQRGMNNFDFHLNDDDWHEWMSRYARFKRANSDGVDYDA